ncbi:DUF4870 domain-containing protein [Lentisphaerota bacterium WC36G]|nr:DUF4870 domain-containing protein [Lentisphaerae bacterium WC36]
MEHSHIHKTRTIAIIAQASAFTGLFSVIGMVIGPLIVKIVCQHKHPELKSFFDELLNFQLSIMIYLLVAAALYIVLIGVFLLPVIFISWLILNVIGLVNITNGNYTYRYPMIMRFF